MITTINISLPKNLYEEAKKFAVKYNYSSVSELIRDALRHTLYPEIYTRLQAQNKDASNFRSTKKTPKADQ